MERSFGRGFCVKNEEEDNEYGYPRPVQVLEGQRFSVDGLGRGMIRELQPPTSAGGPGVPTASAEACYTARGELPPGNVHGQNVNKDGGAQGQRVPVSIKTPKYAGKSDWEAFHAQFELLARANSWSDEQKALQLALCLTDDALSCLLLLDPSERGNYGALAGALGRRFGQCFRSELLRSELHGRQRRTGESLRTLANDIEGLTRRAYAHMPTPVQTELARDQFVRALSPSDLRAHTQLARPQTLTDALEYALEREMVMSAAQHDASPMVRAVGETMSERPLWVDEVTEMIRGLAMPPARRQQTQAPVRPQQQPRLCWGCGQAGHMVRDCPASTKALGNGKGTQ
ncbi:uncharacterized protein LOC144385336 [Gasterosteus aculeatus]